LGLLTAFAGACPARLLPSYGGRHRRLAQSQHRLPVALPPEQAIELFTPEGERKWSEGWNPVYPRPERPEGPGAVFVTGHDGHTTTWTMVDHTARCVRYARVTPGGPAVPR
jgi:hypothetical protein